MSGTTNGTQATKGLSPKITFYTNDACPWAHRAQIVLQELNLPYEKVIVDLDRPRDEWYLKINPRGLVPSIKFSNGIIEDAIITESAIVATFLADAYPSHLLPASHSSPTAPLTRARIAFFVDAYFSKVNTKMFEAMRGHSDDESATLAKSFADGLKKEIEPLLKDASPFLGGSAKMTLAECLAAPFVLRLKAYRKAGMLHASLEPQLDALPCFTRWSEAIVGQESVLYMWDEDRIIERSKARMEQLKKETKAKAKA